MISVDTIEQEILELENRDTSWANVEHLAWLYIVHDHLKTPKASAKTGTYGGSEFCEVCSDVPMEQLMQVLDEHISCIELLHPKEYSAIISKLKELKS